MTWVFLACFVIGAVALGMMWKLRKRHRPAPPLLPTDLAERVEAAAVSIAAADPWRPAGDPEAPESAASIEAALIAGDAPRALAAAEGAIAASPDATAPRVWLAWALCASNQPTAALEELTRVRAGDPRGSGATPAPGVRALAEYVHARAEHLVFEHAAGAVGAVPPLVTTADLAVVTLASGRGAATWLTGATEAQLSAAQVRQAIAEHREITARCLARALDALDTAPGFADAGYLVARLAVKAGAVASARKLFDAIAPRMAGRPDADAFARDRKDLDDPSGAVAAAKVKPVAASAKRSPRLRVLP
jgi:thioredoxin-like negative regulator of GroEL